MIVISDAENCSENEEINNNKYLTQNESEKIFIVLSNKIRVGKKIYEHGKIYFNSKELSVTSSTCAFTIPLNNIEEITVSSQFDFYSYKKE